jgi:hypothetical protein
MHLKAPSVDSSNRTSFKFTNPHRHRYTHLRSSSTSSRRKSPPTCTVSLSSVTSDLTISLQLSATINFPLSAPRSSCVSFPTTTPAAGTRVLLPKHRDTRARAHRVSSRRAYALKSHAARVPIRKQPPFTSPYSASGCTSSPASIKPLTAADLRLTALIERSIASTLSRHADIPNSSLSDVEQQDRPVRALASAPRTTRAPSTRFLPDTDVDGYRAAGAQRWKCPRWWRRCSCAGGKGQTGAGTKRVFVPRASKLRVAS